MKSKYFASTQNTSKNHKRFQSSFRRYTQATSALGSIILLGASSAHAAVWAGSNNSGSNVRWTTPGNWSTNSVPTSLVLAEFTGTSGGTFVDVYVANQTALGITFSGAQAYTIANHNLTLYGSGIVNTSTATQTLTTALALGAAASFTDNGSGGGIRINTTLNNAGYLLTLNGTGTSGSAISGIISGIGGLTKSGTGTWTLSAANTYSGVTTISNGVLSVATIGNGGSAGNLGQATNAAANLVIGGGTLQYTGATASTNRAFTIMAAQTATFDITTHNLTVSGASANTSGALTKIGAGILTLSGANAFTGLTTITAGTLAYGVANALSSGAVTVNGGTLALSTYSDSVGTVTLSSGNITGSGTLTSTGTFEMQSGAVSGILGGSGIALNKTTGGTVTLSGNNTYTGNTTINTGTLALTGSGSIGAGSPIIDVKSGATLNVSGVTAGTWTAQGISSIVRQILTGSGGVTGATVIGSFGGHNAGSSGVGTQAFSSSLTYSAGSIFEWDIDVNGASETHDKVTSTSLLGSGAEFKILLGSGDSFADAFWSSTRNWTATDLFGASNSTVNLSAIFSSANTAANFAANSVYGSFSFTNNGGTGNQLTWTAVPEPTSALAGILLGAGLLRRKRLFQQAKAHGLRGEALAPHCFECFSR